MAKVIDQINILHDCMEDARRAKSDHVYYVAYPLEYDGLDGFIDECQKEITRLEKLNMMDNV